MSLDLIEDLYILYVDFFPLLFVILKYLLVIICLSLGALYLLSLKGIYLKQKILKSEEDGNDFNNLRIILGLSFTILGFGILFNYLIYFFILIFQDFDGFILISLILIEKLIIDSYHVNFIEFNNIITPLIALGSFIAILQTILSFFYFINNRFLLIRPKKSIVIMVSSVIEILLFGFGCLPYLL